ncbi:SIS domain-containing protein [Agaribacterium haliotis]|uniref:SIS domain-containing protein n=1 Tax=Agaribacterium haliotis TaxID=2013869 RepID=UPI000BB55B90|nr:SIS domain-containing protein [Agaribacterium haliotis]
MNSERVYNLFRESVEAKMEVGEQLAAPLSLAADYITETLVSGNKVLVAGNGASSALAQIFCSAMLDRFEQERPSLPAIWLGSHINTAVSMGSDQGLHDMYAKPVRALGQTGDILLVLSCNGKASNLVQAISAAHDRNMRVIALTGRNGGDISSLIAAEDLELRASMHKRSRVHEIHLLCLYCLLDLIDSKLFGLGDDI